MANVEFIIGSSGTGKTRQMFERIRKFQQSGKKVCAIVPEQYSNDFDKKLYFFLGAKNFNNLLSLSFNSLSRQLFQLYGDPNRDGEYADEMARMIVMYMAISSVDNLSFFAKRSQNSGFAEEMLKLITDMKKSGVTLDDFRKKTASFTGKLAEKSADVAAIYDKYEYFMQQYNFKDNLENIREAAKVASLNEYFRDSCVCIDEFESFNADQLDMIKTILAYADNVVITLRTDNINAGEYTLFEAVNSTYRQLRSICIENNYRVTVTNCKKNWRFRFDDLKYLSEHIMRNESVYEAPPARNIEVIEAVDMYGELDHICAEIKRLVHFNPSLKYKDIAVISNNIEDYADIIRVTFERYDIPYFLSLERSINHTAIVVFFLTLLDLLRARKLHSEQIFRLLKCGVLDESLTDVSILENYCYKWGIDGSVWNNPFTAEDENLELIENLRQRTVAPILELKSKLIGNISVKDCCKHIYDYFVQCKAERNIGRIMNSLIKSGKDHEASELKRLWKCIMDIFDSVASTIGDEKMPFRLISDIMRSMVGKIKYSVPPQKIDNVMIASARTARLNSPNVIFVIGATDGDFPNQVSVYGIFSDGDKQKLSEKGIDISRPLSDLVASERLIVYKALSTASDRLYITYPLSNLTGEAKYPSFVVEQIKNMFGDDVVKYARNFAPDFYAVTMKSAYYHYMQDRARNDKYIASIEKALFSDPNYRQKVISVMSKSQSRSEFRLRTETMEKLKSFKPLWISPTGIEDYNKCHFLYFCRRFLSLKAPEKIDIDARIAGQLAHDCFMSLLRNPNFRSMTSENIEEEINANAEKYRTEKLGGTFSKTPRFDFLFDKLKEQLLDTFKYTQESLRNSSFDPDKFEFEVKNEDMFTFGDGNRLSIGGIVDRADAWTNSANGNRYFRIIDYKSSEKKLNPYYVGNGLNLQILIYLFLAAEKNAEYDGCKPAGVLYTPIRAYDIDAKEHKDVDKKDADTKSLKPTGKILADKDVVNAMENGIHNKYVPALLTQTGTFNKRSSSVITSDNMEKLKDFVYDSIVETAEAIHSGDVEAMPVGEEKTCEYCDYSGICGNGNGEECRKRNIENEEKLKDILE